MLIRLCIERTSAKDDQSSFPLVVFNLVNGHSRAGVCLYAGLAAHRGRSIIDLPAGSPLFPDISAYPPPLLLTPLATPGVFGTPPPWDSPPLSALDTPFFCPHLQPLLPHLPMCEGYLVDGARARNSPKIGPHRVVALWPHNDKMVYDILVHYKPFYSGQYRDKVLTKAV